MPLPDVRQIPPPISYNKDVNVISHASGDSSVSNVLTDRKLFLKTSEPPLGKRVSDIFVERFG